MMFVKSLFALYFAALALAAPLVQVSEVGVDHDLNHDVSTKREVVYVDGVAVELDLDAGVAVAALKRGLIGVSGVEVDHDLDHDVYLKRGLVGVSDVAADHDLDHDVKRELVEIGGVGVVDDLNHVADIVDIAGVDVII